MSQRPAPLVSLRAVEKFYGAVRAVHPIDLDIYEGEFVAILGPSGCGKTTVLRMLGGFVPPSAGAIWINGKDVTKLGPERRPTNMVFQGYGLFPHMTVRQNLAYGLRIARVPAAELDRRVDEIMALTHITEFAARMPAALSGGQQQRVALGRALVMRPAVLLLDEPLAALDLKLRRFLQAELRQLHRATGTTFVFVTHDQGEALALADRIVVMENGRVVQEGNAEEIYSRPRSRFVSSFIGEANILPVAEVRGMSMGAIDLPTEGLVVVRPEDVVISVTPPETPIRGAGRLDDLIYQGAFTQYRVALPSGRELLLQSADPQLRQNLRIGQDVQLGWRPEQHVIVPDEEM